jgi:DNA-binding HxlR family transcriptional regulator
MLRDTALIPSEAIRLTALGVLTEAPRRYGELAAEVRHFVSRIVGPSLDLMGSSLELLRHEGLVARTDGSAAGYTAPDVELRITPGGRSEMEALLAAPLRGPINDFGKLVIALKLRFLHLLPPAGRTAQIELLTEICESEVARLRDLKARVGANSGNLAPWLDHEIGQAEERLAWFRALGQRIADGKI